MMATGTLRIRAFAGALVMAGAPGVLAQNAFQVNGRFKVEGGSLDGAHVTVYKNGEKQRTLGSGLAKFSLDLALNADYILEFEKDGFVAKRLSFDTHVPSGAAANGFTPFEFTVNLFKQYDGVNTVVFNQPVGMIRYDKNTDDFDYDTDYTKSIQSALEETMREVTAKQEQEKGREATEAKEQARAEAEKAKQEAEAVKQKAKADKEAAEAAEREQAQKEAEARKAEEERRAAEARKKEDQRRTLAAREVSEPSPVRPAPANERSEVRPEVKHQIPTVARDEELIVEPNQVTMRIQLDNGKERTEYRKVTHKYGQTFYFKDGRSITRMAFESEALAEVR